MSNRATARDALVRKMAERVLSREPVDRRPDVEAPDVGPDYDAIGAEQVNGAVAMLDEDTLHLPRYWLPAIHKAVGPLRGGDVHGLGGMHGNGKTAFCMNVLDGLATQGVAVLYIGLEVLASILRAWWACLHTDIPRYRLRDGSLTDAERDALRGDIEAQRSTVETEMELADA